jgi:hypothetical protein
MNWVVIAFALVFNAFASTHLVAWSVATKMYLLSCQRFMGLIRPMKSKPHFMNGSTRSMVINFTIGACKRFLIYKHASQDWQSCYASLCIVGHQYLTSNTFWAMMSTKKHPSPTLLIIFRKVVKISSSCKHWCKIWSCPYLYNFVSMMVKGNAFSTNFFCCSVEYPFGIFLVEMYVCISYSHCNWSKKNDASIVLSSTLR